MAQVFIAREKFEFSNGATGWRPGGPMDCVGPWAKVQQCPIIVDGKEVARRTAYASGYADTAFSIPANTRYKGKHVRGYFTQTDTGGAEFRVMDSHKHIFQGA